MTDPGSQVRKNSIHVRRVNKEDIHAVQDLIHKSFHALNDIYPILDQGWLLGKIDVVMSTDLHESNFEDHYLGNKGNSLWVAEDSDGNVLGCVGLVEKEGEENAELVRMAVSPTSQGGGIGSKLSNVVDAYCKERNIPAVVLYTANKKSVLFYEKCGYAKVAEGCFEDVIEGGDKGNTILEIFKMMKEHVP